MKLFDYGTDPEYGNVLAFKCPGCKINHPFNVGGNKGPQWTWNGSMELPTFSPSLLVHGSVPERRCHSFVKDGKIQFLSDCYHKLAGQTVDIPEYDMDLWIDE
jgi:hypothetical protein